MKYANRDYHIKNLRPKAVKSKKYECATTALRMHFGPGPNALYEYNSAAIRSSTTLVSGI